MTWDDSKFVEQFLDLAQQQSDSGADLSGELDTLYGAAAAEIMDLELTDVPQLLSEIRGQAAEFQVHLLAHWGRPLDLLEVLIQRCWQIGKGAWEHFGPVAEAETDHRFVALTRLQAKATLTASEVHVLLASGHSVGAMGRWRTLHEVDVTAAFLSAQPDSISYRYLRYEDAQTLKSRRSYDQYSDRLGYEPTDLDVDGDPEELKASLVEEFGSDFLERNGWAIPAFGYRPKDSDIEKAAGLEHYRPYYHFASDAVHATPKGLIDTIQQLGDEPMMMAGPSNAGLVEPGHASALSLARTTIALVHYSGLELRSEPDIGEQASSLLTSHTLLDLTERIGQAFLEAHERLVERQEDTEDLSPP